MCVKERGRLCVCAFVNVSVGGGRNRCLCVGGSRLIDVFMCASVCIPAYLLSLPVASRRFYINVRVFAYVCAQ